MRNKRDYFLLSLLFLLARPLSFRSLQKVGGALGRFCWHVVPFRKQVVLDNLRAAFGQEMDEAAIQSLARDFYIQLGTTLMEFCGYWRLTTEQVCDLVELEGEEHLEVLKAEGRGALLCSGHFGNWELLGARAAAMGMSVSFLVKTQSNLQVDQLQNDLRQRAGVGIIRSGPSIKAMIRALRSGGLIGLLGDQDAGRAGLFIDFMGRPASVFRGTAGLAWRLRCPVITGYIVRGPDGRHKVIIYPPIELDPGWDEEQAVKTISRIHTQRLEEMVRKHPDHYFWVHRRWKTRPANDEEDDS